MSRRWGRPLLALALALGVGGTLAPASRGRATVPPPGPSAEARGAEALRSPEELGLLRSRIRELLGARPEQTGLVGPGASTTAARMTAYRLWQSLPAAERAPLAPLFAPPAAAQCLSSERYPLRSCYSTEGQQRLAEAVLAYAEQAWEQEVEVLGFWPPRRAGAAGPVDGVDLYLGDTVSIGAAGYTSPEAEDPTTPRVDCVCHIVIDETAAVGAQLADTVAHEFNHACQIAMDCQESLTSMEATATWTAAQVVDANDGFFFYAISSFQEQPERSPGYGLRDELYPYGAALFVQFIEEAVGGGDPSIVAQLWEGSVQEVYDNEPDLFDVLLDLAAPAGADEQSLLQSFAEWRYFLGRWDDGRHFQDGAAWRGAEPRMEPALELDWGERRALNSSYTLQPQGSLFAQVRTPQAGEGEGVLVLAGSAPGITHSSRLVLQLWRVGADGMEQRWSWPKEGSPPGEPLTVDLADLAGAQRLVLHALLLRDGVDWDDLLDVQTARVRVALLPEPRLLQVVPAQVLPGATVELRVEGAGLGAFSVVEVLGSGTTVSECASPSADLLVCQLTVAPDAVVGPRDLRVTNEQDGAALEASLAEAFQVTLPPPGRAVELQPASAEPGQRLLVQVVGEDLGPGLEFEFDCPALSVERWVPVDAQRGYLHLAVEDAGDEGVTCDLTVRDSRGQETSLPGAFRVLPRVVPDEEADLGPGPAADLGTEDDVDPSPAGTESDGGGCALAGPRDRRLGAVYSPGELVLRSLLGRR